MTPGRLASGKAVTCALNGLLRMKKKDNSGTTDTCATKMKTCPFTGIQWAKLRLYSKIISFKPNLSKSNLVGCALNINVSAMFQKYFLPH